MAERLTTQEKPLAKRTLRHCDKLSLKSEFSEVRDKGRRLTSRYFVALMEPMAKGGPRCGVVCGRKFSLKAVDRNRARRLLWESFRLLKQEIPPCCLMLIPRRDISRAKMQDVKTCLEGLLLKEKGRPLAKDFPK